MNKGGGINEMTGYCSEEEETSVKKVMSSLGLAGDWNRMSWKTIRSFVLRVQCRIARAARDRQLADLRFMQDVLVNSLPAKILAVEEVTHRPSGKTPGNDGIVWNEPQEKMDAAMHLNDDKYVASPLRRIYIRKSTAGKYRAIGIATLQDRAMQRLYTYALQPVAETWGDPHSFGYRKYRSALDAGETIRDYLCHAEKPVWVLDADIADCFDTISHDWLLRNIPLDSRYLKTFLDSGYLEEGNLCLTKKGVPQGAIISPVLANMTLDGLERSSEQPQDTLQDEGDLDGEAEWHGARIVRYADDFIVMSTSREDLEEIAGHVTTFLEHRGLSLSHNKTAVVTAEQGFDFLHWNFKKTHQNVCVSPSLQSERHITEKIEDFFHCGRWNSPAELVRTLNPLLRGFSFYHRNTEARELFQRIDGRIRVHLWHILQSWFPQNSYNWIRDTFWSEHSPGYWQFSVGRDKLYLLLTTPARVYERLRTDMNPYLEREYFLHLNRQDDMYSGPYYYERITDTPEKWGISGYV